MAASVSVVINNFNYGRFLGEAIQSVFDQDYSGSGEIIVVDDGSTDNSRDVIASFGDRIKPIFQTNQGQAGALNAGIEAARGEIICLLDSDDWWRKDKLRRVVERFERDQNLGMVQHWTLEVDPGGAPLPGVLPTIPETYTLEDFLSKELIFTGTTGLSFRRSVVESILPIPKELRIRADGYLYFVIFLASVGNIAEPLGFRRIHGGNRYAFRYRDPERLEEHIRAAATLHRELQKFLSAGCLRPSAAVERQLRLEQSLGEFFLCRYRHEWASAFEYWLEIGRLIPSKPYAVFKLATLLLAFVSPKLYLNFHSFYSRFPLLGTVRQKLMRG